MCCMADGYARFGFKRSKVNTYELVKKSPTPLLNMAITKLTRMSHSGEDDRRDKVNRQPPTRQ